MLRDSPFFIQAEDWLQSRRLIRGTLCWTRFLSERQPDPTNPKAVIRSIERLCMAARLAPDGKLMEKTEKKIHQRVTALPLDKLSLSDFVPGTDRRRIGKGVILKPCISAREKGVVFVEFENQWARLLGARDWEEPVRC